MSKKDVTLLFVTHATMTAKDFCTRGIVMKKGKAVFDGPIDNAIEEAEREIEQGAKPISAKDARKKLDKKYYG